MMAGAAVLLLFILSIIDWNALFLLLRRTDWYEVLLAVPFLLVSFLLLVTGWRYLLPVAVSWWQTFAATAVAFSVSTLTPLPDSPLRIVTMEQGTDATLTQATAGLVMERLLALIMRLLAFIALIAVWTWRRSDSSLVVISGTALILAAVAAIFWIMRHPDAAAAGSAHLRRLPYASNLHVEEAVANFAGSLAQTFSVRRFLAMLFLFVLIWLSAGLFHVLTLRALPLALDPGAAAAIVLALLVALPPTAPTMIGVYQTIAVGLLLALRLLDSDDATAYAIVVQLPQLLLWLLLGVVGYRCSQLNIGKLAQQVRSPLRHKGAPEEAGL